MTEATESISHPTTTTKTLVNYQACVVTSMAKPANITSKEMVLKWVMLKRLCAAGWFPLLSRVKTLPNVILVSSTQTEKTGQ